jgi:hypothetical protein
LVNSSEPITVVACLLLQWNPRLELGKIRDRAFDIINLFGVPDSVRAQKLPLSLPSPPIRLRGS